MESEAITNMNSTKKQNRKGFTIIELIVVVVIIGILAAITIVSYNGIQAKARDASVLSDIDTMDALQTNFSLKNGLAGKAYYSGSGADATLGFTPSNGNVIDVVTNGTDYCIRGYNPSSTKNSIYNSFTKESSVGICSTLGPSSAAIADSGTINKWTQLSAGNGYTCAVALDNQAYCWGDNSNGKLGNNSTVGSLVPVAVDTSGVLSGKSIKSIAAGPNHTCAIASDNQVYCWGPNDWGQLGNSTTTRSLVPVAVNTSGVLSGKSIKSIAVGWNFTCAIASDNQAYCWGWGNRGELGNGSATSNSVPVAVTNTGVLSGKTIKAIAAYNNTCVIASDNQVYCWGYNATGGLGNGSTTDSSVPVAVIKSGVLSGKTINSIDVGGASCAIASDSQAYCWGYGVDGELGNGSITSSSVPVAVTNTGVLSSKTISLMSSLGGFTCAIASNSQAYCWGYGVDGELGNGSTTSSSVPVAVNNSGVMSGKLLQSITVGQNHACATSLDGQFYCWGSGTNGELGNGLITSSLTPIVMRSAP